MRRRMFEAFRLKIHYDKRTSSARCQVVLTSDTIDATARIATEAMRAGRTDGISFPICVVPPAWSYCWTGDFATNAFLQAVDDTGADFLARLSAARKPPVLRRLDDGSFLSRIGTVEVRIIECEIAVTTTAGRHTGVYRLATTLLDHRRCPAFELVRLYHERWEVESAYFAIKQSMLGRRVLRARTLPGIAQEIYALLTTYQMIRIAIADTTCTVPGADPDRASFSVAFQTARDQVIQAANVFADTTVDLIGAIRRAVLEHLLPARRLRLSPRAVKRPMSRYAYKSLRVDRRTYKATISIDIL
ncbi:transposase [Streptomyces sp. PRKS01-29]|nr:transposase [Streptomyces sabulosicollis]MBI0293191.1 transposase [Streptomyces sabulosicollis]